LIPTITSKLSATRGRSGLAWIITGATIALLGGLAARADAQSRVRNVAHEMQPQPSRPADVRRQESPPAEMRQESYPSMGQDPADMGDRAPWQAPGGPPDALACEPSRGCGPCGPSACDEGGCDECGTGRPCRDECDFSHPFTCGLGELFGNDRFWARAEYLLWWNKATTLPALVTTSPQGTAYDQAGVLGQDTTVLFGGSVDPGASSGARFSLGYWLSDCHGVALEADYFFLSSKAATFSQASQGDPILARPFINVQTGAEDSTVLAYNNSPTERRVQTGSIDIRDTNELDSVELLVRQVLVQRCNRELDLLVGYRYGRFTESLSVNSSTTFVSGFSTPNNTVSDAADLFSTANSFNGAEVGFAAKTRYCRASLELLGKLAIGSTQSNVTVGGSTVVTAPDQTPVRSNGGFLALPSNIGEYQQNSFTMIPEVGFTLGYDFTCRLKATVGYTLVYWSRVARPGDLVDFNLNPSQFPPNTLRGLASPQFKFVTTDFWAQGLSVGLDYRF
jgi:hypothetical protein